jgi:hypothetical protein
MASVGVALVIGALPCGVSQAFGRGKDSLANALFVVIFLCGGGLLLLWCGLFILAGIRNKRPKMRVD